MIPPALPNDAPYTSCYCEENIYLLAQRFSEDSEIIKRWEIFAVFISNPTKTAALWSQKRARERRHPVVWDYHVVLLLHSRKPSEPQLEASIENSSYAESIWIYDFDTLLEIPCTQEDYLEQTFMNVPAHYESLFRIIPGKVYLEHFASDRSHMLVVRDDIAVSEPDFDYSSPPPMYKPICGNAAIEGGVTNNLMSSFVSMVASDETYGDVVDRNGFRTRWSSKRSGVTPRNIE